MSLEKTRVETETRELLMRNKTSINADSSAQFIQTTARKIHQHLPNMVICKGWKVK